MFHLFSQLLKETSLNRASRLFRLCALPICAGIPHFAMLCHTVIFKNWRFGPSVSSKSVSTFPKSICSFHVCESHCGNSCSMSGFFHFVTSVIKKKNLIDELLLIDETWFLELGCNLGEEAVKIEVTTTDWEYCINLVDKAAAGFERFNGNFERHYCG